MRLSTLSRAAVVCLMAAPALTGCTLTIGGSDSPTTSATAAAPAPTSTQSSTQESTSSESASAEPTSSESSTTEATPSESSSETPSESATTEPTSTESSSGSGSDPAGGVAGKRQKIDVPAGHGIQSLELIDLYGAETSSGSFGQGVGVFEITNDRPLMLNLRIQLFDAAGKEVASNTGLNTVYATGTHSLVTRNLIKLPAGKQVKSFKMTLIKVSQMGDEYEVKDLSEPTIGESTTSSGTKVLKGTARYDRSKKGGTFEVEGACVMPDGKVYTGTDNLADNSGDTYEVPLYDADDADLSKARCYASA